MKIKRWNSKKERHYANYVQKILTCSILILSLKKKFKRDYDPNTSYAKRKKDKKKITQNDENNKVMFFI